MRSWTALNTAIYLASIDEAAIVDCYFDDHVIGPPTANST